MEQPLAVNAENSRAKVQNVGGDSSVDPLTVDYAVVATPWVEVQIDLKGHQVTTSVSSRRSQKIEMVTGNSGMLTGRSQFLLQRFRETPLRGFPWDAVPGVAS